MWQEDKEEDVRSYWMTLRTEEATVIWRRKLWIAICRGNVLEEALNLSSDRLLDDDDVYRPRLIFSLWFDIGGKQWQPTPKKLPRIQCARAISVAWLGSGSCQNQPSGWILMMMMIWYILTYDLPWCVLPLMCLVRAPHCGRCYFLLCTLYVNLNPSTFGYQ